MARFTTRVELHDAHEEDYETLHAAMGPEGFDPGVASVHKCFQKISYSMDKTQ